MKILFVITGLGMGGAERVVCDLADKMYEKGHDVKIAYLTGEILTLPSNPRIEVIKVGLTNVFSLPKCYLNLSKIIRSYKPDVIHTHMVHANLLTRLVRLTVPINKLISTAHSSNEGGSLRMMAYRATNRLVDVNTNISKTAVTAFEKKKAVPKNSMQVVYNGVDFKKFSHNPKAGNELIDELGLDPKTRIILAVGRFNEAKNYPNLLTAIKLLKQRLTQPFVLIIAGDGELRKAVEHTIEKLGIADNVVLLGRRNDIPMLMNSCDVFVLSSDYEGLPTVLIEALACKAQVVATDVSGVREIVDKHGTIVPIKQPKALCKAIESELKHYNKNESGFAHVKKTFDLDIITNEWLKIYSSG